MCWENYFSKIFAKKLNLPLYHLDMIWHKKDKTNISKEEFDIRLKEIVAFDKWIIDGNYARTIELRMEYVDIIIFRLFNGNLLRRNSKSKCKKREDLLCVEEELDEELIEMVKNYNVVNRPIVYSLFKKYDNKIIIIFRNREEANNYLNSL